MSILEGVFKKGKHTIKEKADDTAKLP